MSLALILGIVEVRARVARINILAAEGRIDRQISLNPAMYAPKTILQCPDDGPAGNVCPGCCDCGDDSKIICEDKHHCRDYWELCEEACYCMTGDDDVVKSQG